MKRIIFIAITALAFSTPGLALAKDIGELKVGETTCIDIFGPWNKVGTIIDISYSNREVLVRGRNGSEKWHPANKTRNVFSCKLTSEAASWLVDKGIEAAGSE